MLGRLAKALTIDSKAIKSPYASPKPTTAPKKSQALKWRREFCTKLTEDQITRRRLKWRSMERGMKENEIVFRSFIGKHLETLDAGLLPEFEELLDLPDPDLFKWISGREEPPQDVAESKIWNLVMHHVKNDLKLDRNL